MAELERIEKIIEIVANKMTRKETILDQCLNVIFPKKNEGHIYKQKEIEEQLIEIRTELMELQMKENDNFENMFEDEKTFMEMHSLYGNLLDIQLQLMKLQCEIALAKEKHDKMIDLCTRTRWGLNIDI